MRYSDRNCARVFGEIKCDCKTFRDYRVYQFYSTGKNLCPGKSWENKMSFRQNDCMGKKLFGRQVPVAVETLLF